MSYIALFTLWRDFFSVVTWQTKDVRDDLARADAAGKVTANKVDETESGYCMHIFLMSL